MGLILPRAVKERKPYTIPPRAGIQPKDPEIIPVVIEAEATLFSIFVNTCAAMNADELFLSQAVTLGQANWIRRVPIVSKIFLGNVVENQTAEVALVDPFLQDRIVRHPPALLGLGHHDFGLKDELYAWEVTTVLDLGRHFDRPGAEVVTHFVYPCPENLVEIVIATLAPYGGLAPKELALLCQWHRDHMETEDLAMAEQLSTQDYWPTPWFSSFALPLPGELVLPGKLELPEKKIIVSGHRFGPATVAGFKAALSPHPLGTRKPLDIKEVKVLNLAPEHFSPSRIVVNDSPKPGREAEASDLRKPFSPYPEPQDDVPGQPIPRLSPRPGTGQSLGL